MLVNRLGVRYAVSERVCVGGGREGVGENMREKREREREREGERERGRGEGGGRVNVIMGVGEKKGEVLINRGAREKESMREGNGC